MSAIIHSTFSGLVLDKVALTHTKDLVTMTTPQNIDTRKSAGASPVLLLVLFFSTWLLLPLVLVNAFPPAETRQVTVYRDQPTVECNPGWYGGNRCIQGEQTVTRTVTRSADEYDQAVQNEYLWLMVGCLVLAIGVVYAVVRSYEKRQT